MGVPFGNPAFVSAHLRKLAGADGPNARTVTALLRLTSARTKLILLRDRVNPRLGYALHTLAPALVAPVATAWDTLMQYGVESAMGLQQ